MPRTRENMLDPISKELNFKYGKRKGREYAATKAVQRRQAFDAEAETLRTPTKPPMAGVPLRVGEKVLCRGHVAELLSIEEGDVANALCCSSLRPVGGHGVWIMSDHSAVVQRAQGCSAPHLYCSLCLVRHVKMW